MKKILFFIFIIYKIHAQGFSIARIHYSGGGDWYSDPSSIPNLIKFVINNTNIKMDNKEYRLKLDDPKIFDHTYIYITGHGNIRFNENEILNLRKFLLNGGFLHADDNYGMNKSFRREMKKVFPEKEWIELPKDHDIYKIYFNFSDGLQKSMNMMEKKLRALACLKTTH